MLNGDELNLLADVFEDRFAVVNTRILADIGETLKKIEGLTPSQAWKLQQMYTYGADLESITRQLANASGQTVAEIEGLYEAVAREGYEWATPNYDAKNVMQIPFAENKLLQSMVQSMSAVTAGQLRNISNTTTIGVKTAKGFTNFGTFYQKTIDDAITAVATGVEDYSSVIRQSVRELGKSGLRVEYASGYTRRLDSAVRQNVLDGVSYVAQETARRNGETFGADGVELSAHSPCAPDHLSYQGQQYSNGEFEELQKSLVRPIGEWNCRHFPYPIVLGVSRPANSKSELAEMKRYSNEKITIEGKDYTRYECTQIQRKLETKLRYAREEKVLYQAVGDEELKREVTGQIRVLTNKYAEVSRTAGLPVRAERTRLAREKLKGETIVNAAGHGIIKVTKTTKTTKTTTSAVPNSITQWAGKNGGIARNYFGNDGRQAKQISNNGHGHKKESAFGEHGEHAHDYFWEDKKLTRGEARELTDQERKENGDML